MRLRPSGVAPNRDGFGVLVYSMCGGLEEVRERVTEARPDAGGELAAAELSGLGTRRFSFAAFRCFLCGGGPAKAVLMAVMLRSVFSSPPLIYI